MADLPDPTDPQELCECGDLRRQHNAANLEIDFEYCARCDCEQFVPMTANGNELTLKQQELARSICGYFGASAPHNISWVATQLVSAQHDATAKAFRDACPPTEQGRNENPHIEKVKLISLEGIPDDLAEHSAYLDHVIDHDGLSHWFCLTCYGESR